MRDRLALAAFLPLSLAAGCVIDRGGIDPLGGDPDAYVAPGVDADLDAPQRPDAPPDAYVDPSVDAFSPDAWVEPPDAYVPPGVDAFSPDAFTPPDAFVPSDAAVCPRCEGNSLVDCAGTVTPCGLCETGTVDAHCVELVPSNVAAGFTFSATALATDVVVSSEVTWNTGNCDAGHMPVDGAAVDPSLVTHPGAICIFAANSFTFRPGANVHVIGSRPLVVYARDRIVIETGGVLSASSVNSAMLTGCTALRAGAGTGTGGNNGTNGSANDGGGGGGGFCGQGGAGGDATGGRGGAPGASTPSATLTPLVGGADGGDGAGGGANFGGAGGGAIQLSAARVTIHGTLEAFGAGGSGGTATHAGGGGGSGGGVHVEALVLDASGGAIDVRGGAGGGGGCGAAGQCGLQNAAPAAMAGGAGDGTAMCAGDGGAGAGAGSINGDPGGPADNNGGGGGGGAGCVVVRQYRGSAFVTTYPAGVLASPAPTVR